MTLLRSSLVVGVATALSRILGFVRDILIAAVLGAGPISDAFLVALRLPNLVRRVLGEGGVNAGFVPLHAGIASERGVEASDQFTARAISGASVALIVFSVIAHFGAGALVLGMASGYAGDPEGFALTTSLTRLALPAIALLTLAALVGAALNADRRFVSAAVAPLVVNLAMIAVLAAPIPILREDPVLIAQALALTLSLSAVVQLALLGLALRRARPGIRLVRPRFDADMRRLVGFGLPGLLAAGATQFILLAALQAASYNPSAVSHLHYADRLFQLPLGLIGVAVGVVLLPKIAAQLRAGDSGGFRDATSRALEGSLLLALPAGAALLILAEPIVGVLLERGAFTARDRMETAAMLAGLSVGLPFAVAAKVLGQGLFAGERPRAASLAALAGIGTAIAACFVLSRYLGGLGIGLGAALAFAVNAGAIIWLLVTAGLWHPDRRFTRRIVRIGLATLIMAAPLILLASVIQTWDAAVLTAACIGGILLYGLAALLTGAATREDIRAIRRDGSKAAP
jgi:putative peptidoglycan lipid II flippase